MPKKAAADLTMGPKSASSESLSFERGIIFSLHFPMWEMEFSATILDLAIARADGRRGDMHKRI